VEATTESAFEAVAAAAEAFPQYVYYIIICNGIGFNNVGLLFSQT